MIVWRTFFKSSDPDNVPGAEKASTRKAFMRDERGVVAIIFALTSLVVMSLVGGAIDFGRAQLARDRMQHAVDASVLAAARVWQLENDLALAEEKALAHYAGNKPADVASQITAFTPDLQANTITMVAQATISTPFLSLVRNEGFTITTRGQALIANGGNAGTNLEVSIMLDVTGSMAGSKLVDMKAAAKDLIDIVIWSDQSEHTSRVALVPFSAAVNAGDLGPHVTPGPASSRSFRLRNGNTSTRYRTNTYCVSERIGSDALTDAKPVGQKAIPRVYHTSNNNSLCVPSAPVVPLSSNKDMLKGVIDGFQASGMTAGHLGTAWAWYMLSPNWDDRLPNGSRPGPYSELTAVGEKGQPVLKKIAILMTDGSYNYQYCNSSTNNTVGVTIPDYDTGSSGANCRSPNGTSAQQATALCSAMKATGITVYTVGFGLGSSGSQVNLLRNCATEPGMFYNAQNGDELRAAFRHIATSIAAPILSR